jgi:hypothetical protein
MSQHVTTRTIHTIHIDIEDQVISRIEDGDEVEVVLQGRSGSSQSKMSYSAIQRVVFGVHPERVPRDGVVVKARTV